MPPTISRAVLRILLLGSLCSSVASGQEPAVAPGTDRRVDRRGCVGSPSFEGKIDIEVSPAAIKPGEAYALKVYLKNTGPRAMRLKEVEMTARINAEPGPTLDSSLLATQVRVGERLLVAEGTGTWGQDVKVWVTLVKITGENGTCQDRIALKKTY